jgi:hypothetical protein
MSPNYNGMNAASRSVDSGHDPKLPHPASDELGSQPLHLVRLRVWQLPGRQTYDVDELQEIKA